MTKHDIQKMINFTGIFYMNTCCVECVVIEKQNDIQKMIQILREYFT